MVELLRELHHVHADAVLYQYEVHAWNGSLAAALLPLILRLQGVRVIVNYHEAWRFGRFGRLAKAAVVNAPHRIVTTSPWHAAVTATWRRRGAPPDVIAVSSNLESAVGDRALTRTRYGIPADRFVVTSFGFVSEAHNSAELLEAIALTGDDRVYLSVIGGFDRFRNGYHQRLVERARTLGLAERVSWHGRLDDGDDLARLLTISDAVVIPYANGACYGSCALASLASVGVPVITTRGERTQLGADAPFVLCEATSESLAAGIRQVLDADPAERDGLGKASRVWAERLSWDDIADAYLQIVHGETSHLEVV
jgi:glycosyltransferase involved in cell wall biosynthesis